MHKFVLLYYVFESMFMDGCCGGIDDVALDVVDGSKDVQESYITELTVQQRMLAHGQNADIKAIRGALDDVYGMGFLEPVKVSPSLAVYKVRKNGGWKNP